MRKASKPYKQDVKELESRRRCGMRELARGVVQAEVVLLRNQSADLVVGSGAGRGCASVAAQVAGVSGSMSALERAQLIG